MAILCSHSQPLSVHLHDVHTAIAALTYLPTCRVYTCRGYQLIDPELCRPQVRAHVEHQLDLVAKGEADKEAVVAHCMEEFKQKFAFFVAHIQVG